MKFTPKKAFEASLFTYVIIFSSTPAFTSDRANPMPSNFCLDVSEASCEPPPKPII